MASPVENYSLNLGQYEHALVVLQQEQDRLALKPWQERAYKILKVGVYTFGGLLLLVVVGFLVFWAVSLEGALDDETLFVALILLYFIGVPLALVSFVMVVLFFLNLPYFRQLLRQQRLMRRYGFTEAVDAPWRAGRRQKRLRNVFTSVVSGIGVVLAAAAVLGGIALLAGAGLNIEDILDLLFYAGLFLFPLCVTGIALATFHYAQRSRERLELVQQLSQTLEEQPPEDDEEDSRVRVSRETYQKIAQIERAQIVRARTESIKKGLDEVKAGEAEPYLVQKSRRAREAQQHLDPITRLRVHERIDALSQEPHPAEATEHDGRFSLPVADTLARLTFRVDDDARRLQILSIDLVEAADAPPAAEPRP